MTARAAIFTLSLALIGLPVTALAQTTPPAIRFEVASIRPVPPGPPVDNPSFLEYRAGKRSSFCDVCISGVHYDNYGAPLKALISEAWKIDARLLVAPDWINQANTRYAIRALMPEGATREQVPDMLRALLEERFHVVVHRDTVEQTGYALVAAKNGPKLKPPREMDRSACDQWGDALNTAETANQICRTTQEAGDRYARIVMMTHSAWGPLFESVIPGDTMAADAEAHREFFRITMPLLAKYLTTTLSVQGVRGAGLLVQVDDRTGIDGEWDLVFDIIQSYPMQPAAFASSLEKQGLHLERTAYQIEKLFVDKADKTPTEN